ncbi:UNVERIFIED_CONTAM: hypothetical protein GTU68_038014 [Idotea baltica]|nr:hypothetical protein [Idotea baltica]
MHNEVDIYLSRLNKWHKEQTKLRKLILECGLIEDFKWKHPCYTYKCKKIVLIHGFKEYCALLFYKGALLNDTENILIQQTENTQSGRQIRFTNCKQIENQESILKAYIFETIEAEKLGLKIKKKETSEFSIPEELEHRFKEDSKFKTAFYCLTPGRQRGYLLHFSQPKQSKTRISRIEKNSAKILNGKGFNDCTCGLSKQMPNCDGSHKQL